MSLQVAQIGEEALIAALGEIFGHFGEGQNLKNQKNLLFGIGIKINLDNLDLSSLSEVGIELAVDPISWVLTSGEEHLFIATLPSSSALPEGVLQIGEVIQGSGVEVVGEFSDARTTIEIISKKWKHFEK